MLQLLLSIFVLNQAFCGVISKWDGIGGNFINLTIYNNLNYTVSIDDLQFRGNCEVGCEPFLVESCKTQTIYVSTWAYFKDVFLSFKAYRYHKGQLNDQRNLLFKDSLYSVLDLLPEDKRCINEHLKMRKSLVIQHNQKEDSNLWCINRFVDISDEIDKKQCDFGDFDPGT